MPIYEYQCSECGAFSEELMRASDPDPVECPVCGKPGLQRVLSAPAFRLSGSGWYETDFKGDKDKKRNLAGDGAATGSDVAKPADAKPAETKPAAESKPAASPKAGD
jgi:putative FmdB family regulatory protein